MTRNGRRSVQFVAPDGKRHTITLHPRRGRPVRCGAIRPVHRPAAGSTQGESPPRRPNRRPAGGLAPDVRQRLAAAGLIEAPADDKPDLTLADFLAGYIASRADVKPSTRFHLKDSANKLLAFFGPDRHLSTITPGDADQYDRHL